MVTVRTLKLDLDETRGQLADCKRSYRDAVANCDYDQAEMIADEINELSSNIEGLRLQIANLQDAQKPYRNGPITRKLAR